MPKCSRKQGSISPLLLIENTERFVEFHTELCRILNSLGEARSTGKICKVMSSCIPAEHILEDRIGFIVADVLKHVLEIQNIASGIQ